MPKPETIVDLVKALRDALSRADEKALNQIITAYGDMYKRLLPRIDALALEISTIENPTRGQIAKLTRYKTLISEIQRELNTFSGYAETVMRQTSTTAIKYGIVDAKSMVLVQNPGLAATWKTLNPRAIEALIGYMQEGSPLMKRIELLAPTRAQAVANTILDQVAFGANPKTIAGMITKELGIGLTDSLRMTRTVQIYSYREANRASYVANSDVVQGWIWVSVLAPETCAACMALHGTEHSNDETIDDHYNGECYAVPKVIGGGNDYAGQGEAYFNSLSEAEQKNVVGNSTWELLNNGDISFNQLVNHREDEVYGSMVSVTPYKDL
jgi:hypothetical protein